MEAAAKGCKRFSSPDRHARMRVVPKGVRVTATSNAAAVHIVARVRGMLGIQICNVQPTGPQNIITNYFNFICVFHSWWGARCGFFVGQLVGGGEDYHTTTFWIIVTEVVVIFVCHLAPLVDRFSRPGGPRKERGIRVAMLLTWTAEPMAAPVRKNGKMKPPLNPP